MSSVHRERRHPRGGLPALAAALLIGLDPVAPARAAAAAAAAPDRADASQTYSFTFQDADVPAVASEILGTTLGIPYRIDPGVSGKISLRIDQRLTRIQLLEAFEAALAASDIALVHQGDTLILEPPSKARVSAGLRTLEGGVHEAGYQVLAVPLTFATPSEIAKILESVAPANTVVYSNDKLGLLILGGSAKELQSALDTIKVFDRDALEDAKIRWFMLSHGSAETVASDLQKVVQASGLSSVTVVPLKRLNGIVAFSRSPAALDMVATWVDRLDQGGGDTSSNLWVYHPHNVAADALARTLSALLSPGGGGAPATGPTGVRPSVQTPELAESSPAAAPPPVTGPPPGSGFDGPSSNSEDAVRFSVDRESNTLLVQAPLARWTGIQRVLAEIDRSPRQVLIEASILEVTLTRDFHFGVDWSVLGSRNRLQVQNVNNAAGTGTIGPSYPGFSATFLSGTIQAAVTALGAHSDVEVVSAPKIIALDNHVAKLEVGDQVPIITASSQSTVGSNSPIVNSVDYRNTGVILNVTPRISGDDKIVLDIAQEVSSVAQTTTSGINSPTIQERKLESTLVLPDGGVVALGGLISTNKSKTISGIPFIEDAPVIGSLFRGDTRSNDRTELIVLLTTRILPDTSNPAAALTSLASDMAEIKARGLIPARP